MYTVEAGNTEDALLLSEKAESIAIENDMGAEMLSKVYSRRVTESGFIQPIQCCN